MNKKPSLEEKQKEQPEPPPVRTVSAPDATLANSESSGTKILSVDLAEGEDVEWVWSMGEDGRKRVSGYRIVKDTGES